MNTAIILILGIPLIEIYLFIKVGSQIGALNTILLILSTAVVGIWYARYEGFNTLRSGMSQLVKNELPLYEIVSGAAIAFAALLLILPGFATDIIGILLVFPVTRKIILSKYSKKYSTQNKNKVKKKNYIEHFANEELKSSKCEQCRSCLPCPSEIPIPEILRLRNISIGYGQLEFAKERYNLIGRAGHWWEEKDASFCLECNECVPKCPSKLNIPDLLKETHNLLIDKPKKRLWN